MDNQLDLKIDKYEFSKYNKELNIIRHKVIIESFKYLILQLDKDESNYLKTCNKYEKIKEHMLTNKK
jgi:hypothetical protein|tara:strand:- start:89 stop:289 length:201 start_codon:yes stop_codon:yes gene_type:complete